MGVSTDAILAYGIDLGEEWHDKVPWGEEEDQDMEYWLYSLDPDRLDYDYEMASEEEREAVWAVRREFIADFPVEDIHHCSGDYPMLFLAVRGTKVRASRGYPKKIEMADLHVDPFVAGRFLARLKGWGIEFEVEDLAWHLFSYWG